MPTVFKFIVLLTGLLIANSYLFAQISKTKGTIKNSENLALIGVSIDIDSIGNTQTTTDTSGDFFIENLAGKHTLYFRYTGYKIDSITSVFPRFFENIIILASSPSNLNAVTVKSTSNAFPPDKPLLGVQTLSAEENKTIPVIFGEQDILKTLQLFPGIKTAGEGNSGLFVRGGSSDQNLILFDDAPIYNASHLLGFFSMFNSDVIKDVTAYKGDFPANYGGRLSSLIDVKTRDGDFDRTKLNGSIGIIASHLNLEGPIKKSKSSFILSARHTYVDAFLKAWPDSSIRNTVLNFYDLNGKASFKINNNNQLYVSAYKGRDNLGINSSFGFSWGNTALSSKWVHFYNQKLKSSTVGFYSSYDYLVDLETYNNTVTITSPYPEYPFSFEYKYNQSKIQVLSTIKDYGLKHEFQWKINDNHLLNFGGNGIFHRITPGSIIANEYASFNSLRQEKKYSLESGIWLTDNYIWDNLKINYGARLTSFAVIGPGTYYNYDNDGNAIDSTKYGNNKIIKNYINIEPRFSLSYNINKISAIKFGYSRNVQNLHLLSNSAGSTPADIWLSSTNNIKPEISDQISIGYSTTFKDGMYEINTELYYKNLQNQIDYKNGADLQANIYVESQLLYGKGRAYGWETILKKNKGKLTGWFGYTYSRSEKKIAGINHNTYYPTFQDRPHEISIVGVYKANNKWTFSSTFVYYTGSAVTYPGAKYIVDGIVINYYGDRNQSRFPSYNRLDISATLLAKSTEKFESSWTFGIFNMYGRENTYKIDFIKDPDNPNKTVSRQTSLFRFVPSISYNFKLK